MKLLIGKIENRCPNCGGSGKETYWNPQTGKKETITCTWCRGTGKLKPK